MQRSLYETKRDTDIPLFGWGSMGKTPQYVKRKTPNLPCFQRPPASKKRPSLAFYQNWAFELEKGKSPC